MKYFDQNKRITFGKYKGHNITDMIIPWGSTGTYAGYGYDWIRWAIRSIKGFKKELYSVMNEIDWKYFEESSRISIQKWCKEHGL